MKHNIGLLLVLLVVWLAWSGIYKPFLIAMGVLSCALVLLLLRRMGIVDAESAPLRPAPRFLAYLPWLAWEIVKANLDVARRVLDPRLPIRPHLIRVGASQRTDLGRVIYANSITLTPGTVSVDLEGDSILVHALSDAAAEGVSEGTMDRRVARLEGGVTP